MLWNILSKKRKKEKKKTAVQVGDEVEEFVENHLCKLRMILQSRITYKYGLYHILVSDMYVLLYYDTLKCSVSTHHATTNDLDALVSPTREEPAMWEPNVRARRPK